MSTPICGFTGTDCPKSFTDQYLAIILGCTAAAFVLLVAVISTVFFLVRSKRQEEERLNQLWQVHFASLTKPPQKHTMQSSRSLQSTLTTSTKATINSKKDTERHMFFFLNNEPVVARKHNFRTTFTKADRALFRKVISENENFVSLKFLDAQHRSRQHVQVHRSFPRFSNSAISLALLFSWFTARCHCKRISANGLVLQVLADA